MTSRWISLAFAVLAGCTCPGATYVGHLYADSQTHAPLIGACLAQHQCAPLCESLFQLGDQDRVESCRIESLDSTGGAHVAVRFVDQNVCGNDDVVDFNTGIAIDDGSTDDGSDDGSTNDGSDDGSTDDGSDDGSTNAGSDDGSTSDGSDDGSTSDGSDDARGPRTTSSARAVRSAVSAPR